ncbi:hypothetical protein BVRB_042620 [Beta vulgaris subsp. vulgaris]|uniref:Uncharacterized protein n=1 Tax=Beta vulgaris subsp. vulgaris TaxID=3555 RepID=A0A0J7YMG0_BETVV|nr:hypothetical protein BVRB_042620 [Beta vulgaris subsp. vulgaris]
MYHPTKTNKDLLIGISQCLEEKDIKMASPSHPGMTLTSRKCPAATSILTYMKQNIFLEQS